MAVEVGTTEPDDEDKDKTPKQNGSNIPRESADPASEGAEPGEEGDEEDEEEDEPRLKYAPLTKNLGPLYRNGDGTSAFLVAGDKMIVGTHNGNIHTLSLPTFQSLRVYHAHSASISSVSISPFPPPLPSMRSDATKRLAPQNQTTPQKQSSATSGSPGPSGSPGQAPIPATPSNSIYIATSSIDGNVCVASLVDPKDVLLRNFGRPVQAVALSPDYKNDRLYLSGGIAASLILTSGGITGKSANATTTGAAAAASGWLGSIGLGSNTGTDKVLHSGEGIISTIKWSLSGKYVLWVNEQGIKIMRSSLRLESADSDFAWKRMSHIDRPNRPGWEEMAGVWRARAEWFDDDALETEEGSALVLTESRQTNNGIPEKPVEKRGKKSRVEKVVVGWGGTVWIIKVFPGGAGVGKEVGERKIGHAEVATILRTDCIISGVSLYTPNLLLVLAYVESDNEVEKSISSPVTPTRRGIHHRHNALEPELRLIDIETKEEISADTLTVSRYENFSASDYHLNVLPPTRLPISVVQRGTLETIGTGIWEATMYPTRMFSSAASVRSGASSGEKVSTTNIPSGTGSGRTSGTFGQSKNLQSVATTEGMKIFIHSPYNCVIAVKRDLSDRLSWLDSHSRYQQAWELIDEHPEAVFTSSDKSDASSPPTPTKSQNSIGELAKAQTSLADFFADSSSQTSSHPRQTLNSAVEKEKRRIGELWLQQLISANEWTTAGEVCAKVLSTASRWEHWIWTFIRNKKFDEIIPHIPTFQISPPLPSLLYEVVLGQYVSRDRVRFKELINLWPSDLFEINSITIAIEDQIKSNGIPKDSADWRILTECLAKLFLASGRYREALRCYIRLQDADTAMSLIRDYHLLDAVSDDILGLILLRVSREQQKSAPSEELESLTSEPIKLLVDEAHHGVVSPQTVVTQLEDSNHLLYLFFYFRALWRGDGTTTPAQGRTAASTNQFVEEGKTLVDTFADTALELFADFDRPLLMSFLQSSTAYTFSRASQVCEIRHFVPELVYLYSKTGQLKRALMLIINDLKDVSQAITFAKEQDDPDLWDDLLNYSMDKPRFIRGLLAEVGTAINPIQLVKRIPSGLEIEGLREGLTRMIREYDLQASISQGVARVLEGEVAMGMNTLRSGQRKGIKFDIMHGKSPPMSAAIVTVNEPNGQVEKPAKPPHTKDVPPEPGHCAACGKLFAEDIMEQEKQETLVGFACGHVYHLSHLLGTEEPEDEAEDGPSPDNFDDEASPSFARTVGPKVTNARLLKDRIGEGCRLCVHKNQA